MKKALLLSFFVCVASLNKAQEKIIDSLKLILETTSQDTNKINTLLELGKIYSSKSSDSALYFDKAAIDIAKKINDNVFMG